jgi:hypothetical protein
MNDEVDILEHRYCKIHECNLYGRDCEDCSGEGGYHDCGEDCCCCLDPEEPNARCSHCRGTGRLEWCPEYTDAKPCTRKNWETQKTWEELMEEKKDVK